MLAESSLCFCLLLFYRLFKALLINRKPLLLQNLDGQVNRESIGVIKAERVLAGKGLLPLPYHLLLHLLQDGKPLVDGLVKLLFLFRNHLKDKVLLLLKLRVAVL